MMGSLLVDVVDTAAVERKYRLAVEIEGAAVVLVVDR